jgi:AcrR family transcriptional regulator
MADVKTRAYDTSRRQARTQLTRRRAIDAATSLFLERGYLATTMDAVSRFSDVPSATLYRMFPTKSSLLKDVVDVAAAGDDEPVSLHERPEVVALRDETDPARYLVGFAHVARVVHERIEPMRRMLAGAAAADEDAAAMLATIAAQRYAGQGVVARGLAERKALRIGLTEDAAHDIIYALMSPDLRNVLTIERHWRPDRYEKWLADSLIALLLREPLARRPAAGRKQPTPQQKR